MEAAFMESAEMAIEEFNGVRLSADGIELELGLTKQDGILNTRVGIRAGERVILARLGQQETLAIQRTFAGMYAEAAFSEARAAY